MDSPTRATADSRCPYVCRMPNSFASAKFPDNGLPEYMVLMSRWTASIYLARSAFLLKLLPHSALFYLVLNSFFLIYFPFPLSLYLLIRNIPPILFPLFPFFL